MQVCSCIYMSYSVASLALGGRLKSVRYEDLDISSTRGAQSYLERLPEGVRPRETSHSTLARYERGELMPRADLILAYATGAGVRPEWILTGKGPRFEKEEWDPDDPYVGSLALFVDREIEKSAEGGYEIDFDAREAISRLYRDVIGHRWPYEELARLDRWRDRLLKRFHYSPVPSKTETESWNRKRGGVGGIITPDLKSMIDAMFRNAETVEDLVELNKNKLFDIEEHLRSEKNEGNAISEAGEEYLRLYGKKPPPPTEPSDVQPPVEPTSGEVARGGRKGAGRPRAKPKKKAGGGKP